MNTPSKEALEAAKELFPDAIFYQFVAENAAEIIDRHFAPLRQRAEQAEARVKELQKEEAESRRLFYAEQDKRQSAEFRCEELAGVLRKIAAQKPEKPDYWTPCGQCDSNIEDAKEVLARHAAGEPANVGIIGGVTLCETCGQVHKFGACPAGEPAKHSDTELINEFAALCGSLEYCDADDMPSHWRASGYSGSNEGVGRTMRDALRAAIFAARKEVPNG